MDKLKNGVLEANGRDKPQSILPYSRQAIPGRNDGKRAWQSEKTQARRQNISLDAKISVIPSQGPDARRQKSWGDRPRCSALDDKFLRDLDAEI